MAASPLLCVMGPTAAGKTDLAVSLADSLNGELISVDSALVYRDLNIGTAKPDFPHHLIDLRAPSNPYSAMQFARDATAVIAEVRGRGRLPILVGGTMLYFRALLEGLDDMPASDPVVRQKIEADAAAEGWPALHDRLQLVDPVLAARLHPNHSQRIARGLEVWQMTGKPLSDWQSGKGHGGLGEAPISLVICPKERSVLHARIADRLDKMLSAGLLDEVRQLWSRGDLSPDLPAIRAVGYRQLWKYLDEEASLDEAVQNVLFATRQLAKRQMTWLRRWPADGWLLTGEDGELLEAAHCSTPIWRRFANEVGRRVEEGNPLSRSKSIATALAEPIGASFNVLHSPTIEN